MRRDVDDGRIGRLFEMGRRGGRHLVGRGDVDREDPGEVVGFEAVQIVNVDELGDAGIVDQDVEPAPLIDRMGDQRAAGDGICDIGLEDERFRPAAPAIEGGFLGGPGRSRRN